ncbi:hypothetical protein [Piscinibacter sp. HJYY11]|uniref:hypothetical protein n=1 Tax=Piscinibacter sp. HJYY11 TaxID=2801333 RepID=UPI001F46BB32|nr:hypothetical protein [Piscinibacter sp. HJYY11]
MDGVLFLLFIVPLASVWVSVVYFFSAPKDAASGDVLLGALPGLALASLTTLGLLTTEGRPLQPQVGVPLFLVSLVVPPILMALAIKVYRGSWRVPVLQTINAACYLELLWVAFFTFLGLRVGH